MKQYRFRKELFYFFREELTAVLPLRAVTADHAT